MRALISALIAAQFAAPLLASPAMAQDGPAYDSKLFAGCLDDAAGSAGDLGNCIGTAATQCMTTPGGDTTVGMVDCLTHEAKDWDMLMIAFYTKALKATKALDAEVAQLGSSAPPSAPLLEQSQSDWTAFRDSSCRFQAARFQGGTAGGPAAATCMMQLTGEQALRMKDIAEGQQ